MIGETIAVLLALFVLGLHIKGRLANRRARNVTPTIALAMLMIQGVLTIEILYEHKLSREKTTLEVHKHQAYIESNWCTQWRYGDVSWTEFFEVRGHYAHTIACTLSAYAADFQCKCDSSVEWTPFLEHDQVNQLPAFDNTKCYKDVDGTSDTLEFLEVASFYLCVRAKTDRWPRETLGRLVASACNLARKMFNCSCGGQTRHKRILHDNMSARLSYDRLEKIISAARTCQEPAISRTKPSLYDEFNKE